MGSVLTWSGQGAGPCPRPHGTKFCFCFRLTMRSPRAAASPADFSARGLCHREGTFSSCVTPSCSPVRLRPERLEASWAASRLGAQVTHVPVQACAKPVSSAQGGRLPARLNGARKLNLLLLAKAQRAAGGLSNTALSVCLSRSLTLALAQRGKQVGNGVRHPA